MRKAAVVLAAAAAALALVVSADAAAPGTCCVVNGSFETNNLNGWLTTLNGGTIATYGGGGAPLQGNYVAGLADGTQDQWVTLSQTFSAPAGRLQGWVYFDNDDCETGTYNDQGQVLVDNVQVFYWTSCQGDSGWHRWNAGPFTTAGTHTVTYRTRNIGDSLKSSYLYADGIIYVPVISKVGP